MISKKNIFLIISAAAFFALIAAVAYFWAPAGQNKSRQSAGGQSANEQKSVVPVDQKEEILADPQKLASEYPLERGVIGVFKSADFGKGEIVVSGDKDQRVTIVPTTEIFRNGQRADLTDIQKDDIVVVMGRERAVNSGIFVADSIYVSAEVVVPPFPL